MSILSGRFIALKSEANFLTEAMEVRSSSSTSICALGISFNISFFTVAPADTFLTAITTWAPRSARTRAVSVPIPLDAPTIRIKYISEISRMNSNEKIASGISVE